MTAMPPIGGLFADRYEICEEVGRGGAAVVYRARDRKHDRDVALKLLHSELTQSMSAERFVREIEIASRLTHPHILPLYDSGASDGRVFYVSPFIEGESLRSRLDRERQLPLREAVAIVRAVASALECAHAHGIVHRDIKPENILLAAGQPLVADFGIARGLAAQQHERLTATGLVVGTPAYMSPEQAAGDDRQDARSDIYSLGCVLFELLAGEPPFRGATAQAVIANRITEDAPDIREQRGAVPDALAGIIAAMLERLPADRIQTSAQLVKALSAPELEIGVTGSTRERRALRDRIPAGARPLRRRRRILLVTGAVALMLGAAAWAASGGVASLFRTGPALSTLAVLPLANLSGDVQQEFLADGLTEALINDLSRLPDLKVISRTSVMQYKMMRKPMRDIAKELHADVLMEAALMRQGDNVQITAKLVRGRDDQNLWTGSYDGRIGEVLELQRELGVAVAREIGVRFRSGTGAKQPVKPASQVAYLKGSFFAGQWRLEEAIASFQKAVEIDPANAAAYAALARAYYFRAFFGEVPPLEAFSQMRRAATAAIAQDPSLGEAYGLMALVNTHFDYDWAAAEKNFARALQLSPSNAQVHHDYAHFLLAMGRGSESVAASRRAVEHDPANPMLTGCLGWHSLFDQQFDKAIAQAAEAQQLMPSFWAQIIQGWAQTGRRQFGDAVASMQEALALAPELPFARAALAQALARNGQQRAARELLDALLAQAREGYVSAYDIALVYASLDDRDRAFEWLAKALAERSVFVVHLAWDARLGSLRADPRFTELIQRLAIPTAETHTPSKRGTTT
jgi:eukaryotic-like serine/threonine-protein kinase